MKAIHNYQDNTWIRVCAVNYTQRYKKWKQFTTVIMSSAHSRRLWTIHKDTKNESNSQHVKCNRGTNAAVNYTQRYKKWKQFTTLRHRIHSVGTLWTIHKDTKNESNSQPLLIFYPYSHCCELYTKIQKMKAIHNRLYHVQNPYLAVNYTQRYKKWKQFTTPNITIRT